MTYALALWLLLLAPLAQADSVSRLAPTPDALHRERTSALEQRLARMLSALPDVARAEVALTLPLPFVEPLDAPASPARASVVLVRRQPGPSDRADVLSILQGSVPSLAGERLTLIEHAEEARDGSTSFVQIGPFRVHPGSAVSLRLWLSLSLLANVVLAGIVLLRVRA
jgi:type III secretory pathway lipoprotein EscJ